MESVTPASVIPDADLPPATQTLLSVLDDVEETGRHAADPREPAMRVAAAFAVYLRSPD